MQSLIAQQVKNMASLTIRNLDNNLKEQLRQRASQYGRSMEAEARAILAQTLSASVGETNIALNINNRFQSIGLDSLPIPVRQPVRNPPSWVNRP